MKQATTSPEKNWIIAYGSEELPIYFVDGFVTASRNKKENAVRMTEQVADRRLVTLQMIHGFQNFRKISIDK